MTLTEIVETPRAISGAFFRRAGSTARYRLQREGPHHWLACELQTLGMWETWVMLTVYDLRAEDWEFVDGQ